MHLAETFWCSGERVKFSNGATELLLRHWLMRAEACSDRPGMTAVAAFLRHQLMEIGDGGRAFGMDRDCYPTELSEPEKASALAMLIAETAADATQISGIEWDPHHQLWWESRLQQLARAIQAWQPTTEATPKPSELNNS
jgi:hypothetical protein